MNWLEDTKAHLDKLVEYSISSTKSLFSNPSSAEEVAHYQDVSSQISQLRSMLENATFSLDNHLTLAAFRAPTPTIYPLPEWTLSLEDDYLKAIFEKTGKIGLSSKAKNVLRYSNTCLSHFPSVPEPSSIEFNPEDIELWWGPYGNLCWSVKPCASDVKINVRVSTFGPPGIYLIGQSKFETVVLLSRLVEISQPYFAHLTG